jgi:hypothetical protein
MKLFFTQKKFNIIFTLNHYQNKSHNDQKYQDSIYLLEKPVKLKFGEAATAHLNCKLNGNYHRDQHR